MNRKILLIDDDADDRSFFSEALKNVAPEFSCDLAINGRTAIAALDKKEIDVPDIIFMDVNMPVMNGWKCISLLKEREEYKDIPVIMHSTSSFDEDIQKAHHSGALIFFTKPANFRDLQKCLELVVNHFTRGSLNDLTKSSNYFSSVV